MVGLPVGLSILAGPAIGILPFALAEGFTFGSIPYIMSWKQRKAEARNAKKLWHSYLDNEFEKETIDGKTIPEIMEEVEDVLQKVQEKKRPL